MDDISVKMMDTLFDLCDGENYVILDEEDLTSRLSFYTFASGEVTEILEALDAGGFIDLKYAADKEYCVAMRTKGRSLIKQARDRLQKSVETVDATAPREVGAGVSYTVSEPVSEQEEGRTEKRTIGLADVQDSFLEGAGFARAEASRQEAVVPSRREEEEKKGIDWKTVLPAFVGAAVGALLINIIFLIVFFVKFGG